MKELQAYQKPECRVSGLDIETALLTGSTDPFPIDPTDPEFD